MLHRTVLIAALSLITPLSTLFAPRSGAAENRLERVQKDRADVTAAGLWVYNNLDLGFDEARRTGKPLAIVFR